MTRRSQLVTRWRQVLWTLIAVSTFSHNGSAQDTSPRKLNDLLTRTGDRTAAFLDQFSDVKCTEHVVQEKLGKEDKVEIKEDSSYDYLVILTNSGGDLSLSESRLPLHDATHDRKNTSMLLSNGFATLFLVFHPYYAQAFQFTFAGEEIINGRVLDKVTFQHIAGMKSPCRPRPARTRIPAGAFRHCVDRPPDRHHCQNRSRHRRHLAGCRPEIFAGRDRVCTSAAGRSEVGVLVSRPRQRRGANPAPTLA